MKCAVIYSSNTGNTKYLAEALKEQLGKQCIFFGDVKEEMEIGEADLIFVGFWTDKGGCQEKMTQFLQNLRGKKVFLFGTAGFGQSQTYFDKIVSHVAEYLDASNTVVGSWMCQGRMPMAVRARYEGMKKTDPQKAMQMIENFDRAMDHPNLEDRKGLVDKAMETVKQITQ